MFSEARIIRIVKSVLEYGPATMAGVDLRHHPSSGSGRDA